MVQRKLDSGRALTASELQMEARQKEVSFPDGQGDVIAIEECYPAELHDAVPSESESSCLCLWEQCYRRPLRKQFPHSAHQLPGVVRELL